MSGGAGGGGMTLMHLVDSHLFPCFFFRNKNWYEEKYRGKRFFSPSTDHELFTVLKIVRNFASLKVLSGY